MECLQTSTINILKPTSYHQHLSCYKIQTKNFSDVLDKGLTLHQNLRLRNKNCQIKPSAAAKTCGYNGEISQKPKNLTIGTGQVSQQFSTGKIV
ncbi:hypothetical protein B5E64_11900 [Drancourtella sp. An12]|nr:hypothetical protein B5E64_11900 [Drancourtella sp. An12]